MGGVNTCSQAGWCIIIIICLFSSWQLVDLLQHFDSLWAEFEFRYSPLPCLKTHCNEQEHIRMGGLSKNVHALTQAACSYT